MAISLTFVLQDPPAVAQVLQDGIPGCRVTRARRVEGGAILDISFPPLPDLSGYPPERARVVVLDDGEVRAYPVGPPRSWQHRDPSPVGAEFGYTAGALCLYYPDDPAPLTWTWDDGLERYVEIVRRHLIFEEAFRRNGEWPVEDAPHGQPEVGSHPIKSKFMREEAKRWAR